MARTQIYKSTFLNKKTGEEIEPFYIVGKSKNKMEAKQTAKSYFEIYWSNKNQPQKKIALLKILSIQIRKLKKL